VFPPRASPPAAMRPRDAWRAAMEAHAAAGATGGRLLFSGHRRPVITSGFGFQRFSTAAECTGRPLTSRPARMASARRWPGEQMMTRLFRRRPERRPGELPWTGTDDGCAVHSARIREAGAGGGAGWVSPTRGPQHGRPKALRGGRGGRS